MVTIQAASQVPLRGFVQALNEAYTDYYIPIHLSPPFFREMVRRESLRLESCAAAVVKGRIVGTGLLGVRGRRAWIGGMGVIPTWRRQGVGRQLMDFLIEQARRLRITRIQLEVIDENTPAYNLYDSLGFITRRRLLVLACDFAVATPPNVDTIEHHRRVNLDRLPPPTAEPPWQRSVESLHVLRPQLRAYTTQGGACVYMQEGTAIGLLVLTAERQETGRALLHRLLRDYWGAHFTFLNVPQDDPMLPILREAGFRTRINQYDMLLHLD